MYSCDVPMRPGMSSQVHLDCSRVQSGTNHSSPPHEGRILRCTRGSLLQVTGIANVPNTHTSLQENQGEKLGNMPKHWRNYGLFFLGIHGFSFP